jgi:hypothetical protein
VHTCGVTQSHSDSAKADFAANIPPIHIAT